jgi:hypothetical protein
VNHPTKITKISSMCQLMKDLKDTCPMTRVHDFFRIYRKLLHSVFRALGCLLFRLGKYEARSSKAIFIGLPFKTHATLELRRL